jgi:hypothetical protein
MKKNITLVIFAFMLTLAVPAAAQESTLLHFMRHSPQSLRSNPANLSDSTRFFMGIPFLSSFNVDFNLGFAYSDAITRDPVDPDNPDDDVLRVNKGIVDQLTRSSRMGLDVSYELLSFGVRFQEDNMITLSLATKAFGTFLFPKDLATMLVEGNSPGGTLNIESDINASAYLEAALGYSRVINSNWKMGVRVKYLVGLANAYSNRMQAKIATDPNDYSLTLSSDVLLRTAMFDPEGDPLQNAGLGFDAGVYYKSPIEGLEFSFSLIDWGYIQWHPDPEDNGLIYRSKDRAAYTFQGITNITDNGVDAILDEVKDVFERDETVSPEPYSSPLLGKIFLGTSYDWTKHDRLGFLFSTRALQKFSRTTFGLMYSRRVGNWFTVSAGNNFMLHKLFNPSLALLLRAGGFQFHIVGENISSFYVKDISSANIQFGMNIAIH